MKLHKLIFIVILILIYLPIPVFSQSIPYEGLTLEWSGTKSFTNQEYPSANSKQDVNYLYIYKTISNGLIQQKNINDDTEELIDIKTGIFATGDIKGNHTSQWISVDVNIGSKVNIYTFDFTVMSLSDEIYLKDFGRINAIKLVYKENKDDYKDTDGYMDGQKSQCRTKNMV